jgi:ribosomal protein L37E
MIPSHFNNCSFASDNYSKPKKEIIQTQGCTIYCSRCGKKLESDDKFCSGCGIEVSKSVSSSPKLSNYQYSSGNFATPKFVLKPRFIPLVTILSVLPLQLFFTLWGAGFFGGFGMFAVQALGLDLPPWFTFVFFAMVFFFRIPILTYFASTRTYAKT